MLFNSMDIVNDDQFGTDHVIDFVLMSGNVRITLWTFLVYQILQLTKH